MFMHKIKINIPFLNKVDAIDVDSTKNIRTSPLHTIKKLNRSKYSFSIIKRGVVVGHACELTGAIDLVREDVIYSEWSDEIPIH